MSIIYEEEATEVLESLKGICGRTCNTWNYPCVGNGCGIYKLIKEWEKELVAL